MIIVSLIALFLLYVTGSIMQYLHNKSLRDEIDLESRVIRHCLALGKIKTTTLENDMAKYRVMINKEVEEDRESIDELDDKLTAHIKRGTTKGVTKK